MAAIYNLRAWLEQGNAPGSATDAADLEQALLGRTQGQYRAELKQGGEFVLVTGPGAMAFLFNKATRDKHLAELRATFESEPGASLQGDAAFERGMLKED